MIRISHDCRECNTHSNAIVDFNISNIGIQDVSLQHPDWMQILDSRSAKLGAITCPKCGTRNHIIILRKKD